MDTQKVGKFIAGKRKEKKLTQAQFGEMLGVANKTISKWENGVYMPDLSLLIPISEILEVSLNELLAGESLSKEEMAEQAETSINTAICCSNEQVKRIRKKYGLTVLLLIAGLIGIILLINQLLFVEIPYQRGNTKEWEDYFPKHSAYKLGIDEEGNPVFLQPDTAIKKAKSDYSDALAYLRQEYDLMPFSKYTYKSYSFYIEKLKTNEEYVNVQLHGLKDFIEIYQNSFQEKNLVEREDSIMAGITLAGLGFLLAVSFICTEGFDIIRYFLYKGRTVGIIKREEAFTVSKSRRSVEKQVGGDYQRILSTEDRSVHYFPYVFYGKTQAILEWSAEQTNWRARYPYLRKRGEWQIGEEIEIRYSLKRPWKYAICDKYMWGLFVVKMIFCIGCFFVGSILFIGSI